MNLLFLRKNPLESVVIVFLLVIALVGLPYLEVGSLVSEDEQLSEMIGLIICRAVAVAITVPVLVGLGFGGAAFPRANPRSIIVCEMPALLIAINNLPLIALAFGTAGVTANGNAVLLFFLECLFVAAFEEICFRGMIFPLFLQKFGTQRKGRLVSVICSSALFGLTHFINLFSGAALGAVALQAGYSFLIGAMLAVVFFEGGSLFICTLIHAVYNFCGLVVPTLGFGEFWDVWNLPTIIITAVLACAVIVLFSVRLLCSDGSSAKRFVAFSVSAEEMRERTFRF